jgi:hypothetical protein
MVVESLLLAWSTAPQADHGFAAACRLYDLESCALNIAMLEKEALLLTAHGFFEGVYLHTADTEATTPPRLVTVSHAASGHVLTISRLAFSPDARFLDFRLECDACAPWLTGRIETWMQCGELDLPVLRPPDWSPLCTAE